VSRAAVASDGRLAIIDHSEPEAGILPRAIFSLIRGFEPPSLDDWARSDFEAEIRRAGFEPERRVRLARGTARAVVASVPRRV
jgi:hypothetical protein